MIRLNLKRERLLFVIICSVILLGMRTFSHHAIAGARQTTRRSYGKHTFLFLSDIHLDTRAAKTSYGNDTGEDLWKQFINKVNEIMSGANAPDFVVYTGDLPAHYKCSCFLAPGDRATHNANDGAVLDSLRSIAHRFGKPVFYLPGNNDALAGDYYSFADEKQQTPLSLIAGDDLFFPGINKPVGTTAPCKVSDPYPSLGFYAAYPVDGLRLIALNTVIYSSKFKTVDGTTQQADGDAQMNWLAGQLADAATKKERVIIAMHIPPGEDAFSKGNMWIPSAASSAKAKWQNTFLKLVATHKDIITGILYGHTHMDEVRRLYDPTGKIITEVAFSCPGVTPQHLNNPGFKVVTYAPDSKELMDFTTYYTEVGQSKWGTREYSFGNIFNSNGASIYTTLSKLQSAADVDNYMEKIYTVKHPVILPYKPVNGIEVRMQ